MTRLYPAYARDVLSFLNFLQLQECCLVSRSLDATIANNPASFPARRRIYMVNISIRSVSDYRQRARIDEDGNATAATGLYKPWREVQAEWGCSREELEVRISYETLNSLFWFEP